MFSSAVPRDVGPSVTESQVRVVQSSVYAYTSGLFVESLVFGMLVVIFFTGTWKVLSEKQGLGMTKRDKIFVMANALMFVLATVHLSLDAHIMVSTGLLRGADLALVSNALNSLNDFNSFGAYKTALLVAQMMIGDGFMVYRAYIIWNRSWAVVMLPLVCLIAEVLLGFTTSSLGRYHVAPNKINACLAAFFVLTAVTNVLSTALVLKPVLFPRQRLHEYHPDGWGLGAVKWRVMRSVLHSAAIFTVSSVLFVTTFFTSPHGFAVCHTIFLPTVAIVFSLTITRMCLNNSSSNSNNNNNNSTSRLSLATADGQHFSQSYPTLPIYTVQIPLRSEREDARPRERTNSRAITPTPLSPITIHVSVTTTSLSDRESRQSTAFDFDGDKASLATAKESLGHGDGAGLRDEPLKSPIEK
ncbi:uncharacterized protein BXZ73DRAFT_105797 [Epithele typhae]|uniref:uncharacterized protein n=1 Tax=Epithele typhae TaxID=378194 RepID=UPI00200862AC|nr:uncharacterized protein BXZ73DRAFT_105797 [Epithele typhae]KAH9916604.1 hypothetical protein BXZ73DRAFT_105797 [Epithele typhae]